MNIIPPSPTIPITRTGMMSQVYRTWTQLVSRTLGGIPEGGNAGYVLTKTTDDDFDTEWASVGAGSGGIIDGGRRTTGIGAFFGGRRL